MSDRQSPQPIRQDQAACSAIADLLPAYALGGIDLADRILVEQHLRTCDNCRETVDAYTGIAAGFPLLVPQDQEPSPATWRRIASRIAADDAVPLTTAYPPCAPGIDRANRRTRICPFAANQGGHVTCRRPWSCHWSSRSWWSGPGRTACATTSTTWKVAVK